MNNSKNTAVDLLKFLQPKVQIFNNVWYNFADIPETC